MQNTMDKTQKHANQKKKKRRQEKLNPTQKNKYYMISLMWRTRADKGNLSWEKKRSPQGIGMGID